MKKLLTTIIAMLLCGTAAIALATLPDIMAGNTVHLSVTIDPAGAGSVERSERDIVKGGNATFTAVANGGYSFNGWYVDGALVSSSNPYQFKSVTTDLKIIARFNTLDAANLTLAVKAGQEDRGSVSASPGGTVTGNIHKYTAGTEVTITATPAKGYTFDHWETGDGTVLSQTASYKMTVSSDMAVYAVFAPLANYRSDLIAFPGAEGYGRFTTGGRMVDGRGSKVYYVTRLDDSDEEGTFRWAVTTGDDTPRTVLFKVAGTIYLKKNVDVKSNTTIAGQTAPAGGICLAGYRVKLGSNIIVRHIRFRAGDLPKTSMSPLGVENVKNIILDHCSIGWSMEENMTMYDCDYTTVQWCIFAEGLYDSRNAKGNRAYGAQWGGEHATMHHCLFANNNSRSPRFNGVRDNVSDRHVDNEFVNNVIYNWGSVNAVYGGECSTTGSTKDTDYNRVYMIGNYYRPGPATKNATSSRRYWVSANGGSIDEVGQWYLSGNKFETASKWAPSSTIWSDAELNKVNEDNYYGFVSNNSSRAMNFWSLPPSQTLADKALLKALPEGYQLTITPEAAEQAYQKVVLGAGASLPRYDEVDVRVLSEAAGQRDPQFGGARGAKLGIIDSPYDITLQAHDRFVALYEGDKAADDREIDVTCYPLLQMDATDCRVQDADGDGLPDAYETEVGLNPGDAADGAALDASGYSHLELFLNGVASGTIDAKKYTKHQAVAQMSGFDAIVGEGGYSTLQAAIDAAPAGDAPYYIFVKAGTYEGHVQISRSNIHVTGQSKHNTIVTWNKVYNDDGGSVYTNATVNVGTKQQAANDVSFDNLTLRNTRAKAGQALALFTNGDRILLTNCNVEGYQDTWRTADKDGYRQMARNCKISGRTDFIYNRGEVFFDSDTLHIVESGGYVVAPAHINAKYGYVFRNCVMTAAQAGTQTYLGRPWTDKPKVAFIDTRLADGVSIYAQGWVDMDGLPSQMAEYNTRDAAGNAVDLSQRKTSFTAGNTTASSKAVLTPLEADGYRASIITAADFIGPIMTLCLDKRGELISQEFVSGNRVSWSDPSGYARCFVVVADGKATVTTDHSIEASGTVTVQAVSAYGVLGLAASSAHPSEATELAADVNNDGVVNVKDVVALVGYLLGRSGYIDTSKADQNGDGKVTVADVVRLIAKQ